MPRHAAACKPDKRKGRPAGRPSHNIKAEITPFWSAPFSWLGDGGRTGRLLRRRKAAPSAGPERHARHCCRPIPRSTMNWTTMKSLNCLTSCYPTIRSNRSWCRQSWTSRLKTCSMTTTNCWNPKNRMNRLSPMSQCCHHHGHHCWSPACHRCCRRRNLKTKTSLRKMNCSRMKKSWMTSC